MTDIYIEKAIELAKLASENGDVPVGAVIEKDGIIISEAYNTKERDCDPTGHAEINAIRAAAEKLNTWRLDGCTIYVTMEPCPMCAGAIMNSRIQKLVFGAKDPVCGAFGTVFNICNYPIVHKPQIAFGAHEQECARLLREFFGKRREND